MFKLYFPLSFAVKKHDNFDTVTTIRVNARVEGTTQKFYFFLRKESAMKMVYSRLYDFLENDDVTNRKQ